MTTTKSYSNGKRLASLYKSAMKNQLPIMIVFFIIYFLSTTLVFIVYAIESYRHTVFDGYSVFEAGAFLRQAHELLVVQSAGILAAIMALIANGYMHQKRMVDLYHSLPVTRSDLMTGNFLASMTTLIGPYLVNVMFTVILKLIIYGGYLTPEYLMLCTWGVIRGILTTIIYAAVVYLFITFIAANVGTLFDTFAISCILGFSVIFIYLVSGYVWSDLIYGAVFEPGAHILLMSPFTFIHYPWQINSNGPEYFGQTLLYLAIFLVAAVAFYFLALHSYKKRKSETAEKTQTDGIFQRITKFVACFAGAALLYLIFKGSPTVVQVMAVFIGAMLVGVVAELILSRGLRSLVKNLKWLTAAGAICSALLIIVTFDLTGVEKRVPDPQSVKNAEISYMGRFQYLTDGYWYYSQSRPLTETDSIAVVTLTHEMTAQAKRDFTSLYLYVNIKYNMKNGFDIKRQYSHMTEEAAINLAQLENKPDFIASRSPLFYLDTLPAPQEKEIDKITVSNRFMSAEYKLALSEYEIRLLIDAVKADMLDESIEGILHPDKPSLGYLTFSYRFSGGKDEPSSYRPEMAANHVIVTGEYTRTIELLKSFGYYDKMTEAPETPDTVYFIDQYRHNSELGVQAITGSYSVSDQEIYSYIANPDNYYYDIVEYTDAETVRKALEDSRCQMLEDEKLYYAVFSRDGHIIGTNLIRESDLPYGIEF